MALKGKKFKRKVTERTFAVKPRNGGSPPKDKMLIANKNFVLRFR
jgi:hypothetical protein